jgi:hypothetical protein
MSSPCWSGGEPCLAPRAFRGAGARVGLTLSALSARAAAGLQTVMRARGGRTTGRWGRGREGQTGHHCPRAPVPGAGDHRGRDVGRETAGDAAGQPQRGRSGAPAGPAPGRSARGGSGVRAGASSRADGIRDRRTGMSCGAMVAECGFGMADHGGFFIAVAPWPRCQRRGLPAWHRLARGRDPACPARAAGDGARRPSRPFGAGPPPPTPGVVPVPTALPPVPVPVRLVLHALRASPPPIRVVAGTRAEKRGRALRAP